VPEGAACLVRPRVVSVNLAGPRTLERRGRPMRTGIWKVPAISPVKVDGAGLDGDFVGDRRAGHGPPDKTVYAYSRQDYDWWEAELGRSLGAGMFGENLTVEGLDASGAVVGERWRAGTALLEVTGPRLPCWKLGVKMGDRAFVKRFGSALRLGAYLRVIEEGEVAAGDAAEVIERPGHDVTVGLVGRAMLGERALAPRLLEAPALGGWARDWAARQWHLPRWAGPSSTCSWS
jgi:MOSC domain-containing protein YiiM